MRYSVTWINSSQEKNTGWLPEILASQPSEKIDHTKCGLLVVEEPPPEVVTHLLEEFPDVFAELPKGLSRSRPTDHPIVVDETQTPLSTAVSDAASQSGGDQKASGGIGGSMENPTFDEPFWC